MTEKTEYAEAPVDVEALKIQPLKLNGERYHEGWNHCIDHLAAKGLVSGHDDHIVDANKMIEGREEIIRVLRETVIRIADKSNWSLSVPVDSEAAQNYAQIADEMQKEAQQALKTTENLKEK